MYSLTASLSCEAGTEISARLPPNPSLLISRYWIIMEEDALKVMEFLSCGDRDGGI